jgi:hypothetical protein
VAEIVFALEFRGRAGAVPGSPGMRQARSAAASQILRTAMGREGIECRIDPIEGQDAVLESVVERFPDGTFIESGTIAYGDAGRISFATLGRGTVGPAPASGWVWGGVTWVITGGEGRFAGAQGLITSNFAVSAEGEVIDDHFTRLHLPS